MSVGGGLNLGECRGGAEALVVLQVGEHGRVTAECAGGEECVVRRKDEVATVGYLHEVGGCGFEVLVVAAEELEAEQVVAGDEALNLIEDSPGIEGAQLGLEIVSGEPDCVTICFAGLCASGLAHV